MTRLEIYGSVWEAPLSKVAERLAVSPALLRFACRAADIPVPSRGHWAKAALGRAPRPPKLAGEPNEHFVLRKRAPVEEVANAPTAEQDVDRAVASEVASASADRECAATAEACLRALEVDCDRWIREQSLLNFIARVEAAAMLLPAAQATPLRAALDRVMQNLQTQDPVRTVIARWTASPP
jgi:hypothetical protein